MAGLYVGSAAVPLFLQRSAKRSPIDSTSSNSMLTASRDRTTALRNAILILMTKAETITTLAFTPGERSYIRRELDLFFTTLPTVAEGFQLKTWKTGPLTGQPKLPPAAKSLVERGLMQLEVTSPPPRLFFTEKGRTALRSVMADPRLADPQKFAHIRRELGLGGNHTA